MWSHYVSDEHPITCVVYNFHSAIHPHTWAASHGLILICIIPSVSLPGACNDNFTGALNLSRCMTYGGADKAPASYVDRALFWLSTAITSRNGESQSCSQCGLECVLIAAVWQVVFWFHLFFFSTGDSCTMLQYKFPPLQPLDQCRWLFCHRRPNSLPLLSFLPKSDYTVCLWPSLYTTRMQSVHCSLNDPVRGEDYATVLKFVRIAVTAVCCCMSPVTHPLLSNFAPLLHFVVVACFFSPFFVALHCF